MLTLEQCIAITQSKRATAARDLDYFGTLIHEGWSDQTAPETQAIVTALYAEAQAAVPAYDDVHAILQAL